VAGVVRTAIALGSNLGDRRAHLAWAASQLGQHLDDLHVSSIIETEPVGVSTAQPPYLNAVVAGRTTLQPHALLGILLALERRRGRVRTSPRAPRTLDMDLILFGDAVIDDDELTVPHPRFRERRFVLEPLAELAGGWRDPVTGKTVASLMAQLAVVEEA
jgi:2-amino-4-hydroxy-6-hydroxymethyldihydropteridine diphosphokinase